MCVPNIKEWGIMPPVLLPNHTKIILLNNNLDAVGSETQVFHTWRSEKLWLKSAHLPNHIEEEYGETWVFHT